VSITDVAEFNQGRTTFNKEWTPGHTDEITINIVDVDDASADTSTVIYFKKRGMASGLVLRPTGDSVTINSIIVGAAEGTEEFLNGDPFTVASNTAVSWTKRMSDNIKQIKIQCASATTHVRLLVF